MKGTSWEGGFGVPCIVRWPGRLPAGRVVPAPAVTMDLFATALAAAGAAPPDDRTIDGNDLLPLLEGRAEGPREVIFGQQGARLATVRDGRWKLHVLPASDRREPMPEGRWGDPRGPDGVTLLAVTSSTSRRTTGAFAPATRHGRRTCSTWSTIRGSGTTWPPSTPTSSPG
jgi:hypothetical protein